MSCSGCATEMGRAIEEVSGVPADGTAAFDDKRQDKQPADDAAFTCPECDGEATETSYCGSFCEEHMAEHLVSCEICARDWH